MLSSAIHPAMMVVLTIKGSLWEDTVYHTEIPRKRSDRFDEELEHQSRDRQYLSWTHHEMEWTGIRKWECGKTLEFMCIQ